MKKEKIIPAIAIILILISLFSTIYVYATHVNRDTIVLNGNEYTIDEIFAIAEKKTVKIDGEEKTGASLEDLILKSGIACPSCNKYTIKGKDSYQQTVDWDILKTGIIDRTSRVYFPNMPKKFWVSNVIEIEVIKE